MLQLPSHSFLSRWLWQTARNDHLILSILALIVGAAAGYGALGFRLAADLVSNMFWGVPDEQVPSHAVDLAFWIIILIPTAGGLVIGLLTKYILPGPQPQGVADVIEASALRHGRMDLKAGLAAAFLSFSSIGVGASVGREGPIVHLGAVMASRVAQRLSLSRALTRTLLGCGVSAGIAAAFNAPIAGVFFALEVVIGHYGLGAFSPVVLASIVGTIITRVHIGDNPAFVLPPDFVASFWEVPAFVILGVLSAGVSVLLMSGVALARRLHELAKVPDWLRPMVGGLLVGLIAIRYPEVLGVGYQITDNALNVRYALDLMILMVIAKAAATAISLGSNFGGGIFSPSLAIGALFGGAFGIVAGGFFPEFSSTPLIYAVVGMGAVAASTLGAPISTIIMIFELTSNYEVTFALMVSAAIASILTRQLFGYSFFTWQLAWRGVKIEGHREMNLLRTRKVREVMRTDHLVMHAETCLFDMRTQFHENHAPIFVVDDDDKLVGSISFEDLADAALSMDVNKVTAKEILHPVAVALTPDDDLATAFSRCQVQHEEHIPVVESRQTLKVIGDVRMRDLVQAYNRALLDSRAAD